MTARGDINNTATVRPATGVVEQLQAWIGTRVINADMKISTRAKELLARIDTGGEEARRQERAEGIVEQTAAKLKSRFAMAFTLIPSAILTL